jgi:hypothetical protein
MAPPVPDNPDTLLTRSQTGAALRAKGFPVADRSLATLASRGGGPPFRRFRSKPLYIWGDVLAWAHSRLSAPVRSTSEQDAPEPVGPANQGRVHRSGHRAGTAHTIAATVGATETPERWESSATGGDPTTSTSDSGAAPGEVNTSRFGPHRYAAQD